MHTEATNPPADQQRAALCAALQFIIHDLSARRLPSAQAVFTLIEIEKLLKQK